jgi:lipopolysaccharide biosynthesis glycosyltransferase
LIDLERVREEGLFSRALEFASAHIGELRFVDQDALNYALWRRWRRLEPRWNVQRHMVIPALNAEIPSDRRLRGRPAIIHYTGPEKPWVRDAYHPWSWLYWRNLARTPFFAQVCREQRVGSLRRFVLWQRWLRRRATV